MPPNIISDKDLPKKSFSQTEDGFLANSSASCPTSSSPCFSVPTNGVTSAKISALIM